MTEQAPHPKVPAGVTERRIKSYVKRAGRTTLAQAKAQAEHGARFLLPYQSTCANLIALFSANTETPEQKDQKSTPVILEIGFGMGEATAHIAAVRPEVNFLCCEVHEAGVAALIKRASQGDLHNIRIVAHDAVEVLEHMLAPASLDGLHLFFPDPWHKLRHNKRRLVQAAWVAQVCSRLKPGALLHMATDWEPYAQQMLQVLSAEPQLRNTAESFATKPWYRPLTKFENRGLKLGHGVWDLVFEKV